MVNKIVSIPGYVHLYRSLLRFYHSSENEIKEMLYVLNTANLDCFGYYHPEICVVQRGPALFSTWLDNMNYRPYRTEVQLHKALVCLKHSVDREFMTVEQREALQQLCCIISNIEYRFYKAFGVELDDDREFLYGRVRQRYDPFKRVLCVGFFIQHQQIVHAVNFMPALRQPRGKDRMLFRLPDRAGVQNFNFNSFDRVFPP